MSTNTDSCLDKFRAAFDEPDATVHYTEYVLTKVVLTTDAEVLIADADFEVDGTYQAYQTQNCIEYLGDDMADFGGSGNYTGVQDYMQIYAINERFPSLKNLLAEIAANGSVVIDCYDAQTVSDKELRFWK